MAVREFTDGNGREWRAWDVVPEDLNARTKDEDYLAQLYHTGWIVFETVAGGEDKRRLYPVPKGWSELPDAELVVLLSKAEVVPRRKLRSEKSALGVDAAGEVERAHDFTEAAVEDPERARAMAKDETPDVTDLNALRTFRYPGGRIWVASVVETVGGVPVLRFTAGARNIDLRDWPKDWVDYQDERLVQLLRDASPRPRGAARPPNAPRRRWDDGQAESR